MPNTLDTLNTLGKIDKLCKPNTLGILNMPDIHDILIKQSLTHILITNLTMFLAYTVRPFAYTICRKNPCNFIYRHFTLSFSGKCLLKVIPTFRLQKKKRKRSEQDSNP